MKASEGSLFHSLPYVQKNNEISGAAWNSEPAFIFCKKQSIITPRICGSIETLQDVDDDSIKPSSHPANSTRAEVPSLALLKTSSRGNSEPRRRFPRVMISQASSQPTCIESALRLVQAIFLKQDIPSIIVSLHVC